MRQFFRCYLVLFSACTLFGLAFQVEAQQIKKPVAGGDPNQQGRATAPKAAAATGPAKPGDEKSKNNAPEKIKVIAPVELSSELEDLLIQWERESSKIKWMHGKHTRREDNDTFAGEKISKGEFFLETPDKGRIDMIAVAPKKNETGIKKDKDGNPYSLERGQSEKWICTGDEIININEDEHTYTRDDLPPGMRGKNIVHSPLPFLFGMKADEAKSRFALTLAKPGKDSVWLKAVPRMESDRQNYEYATILLDTKRYIPIQVNLFDTNGGIETHYEFTEVTINDSGIKSKLGKFLGFGGGDPYKPNLKNYTLQLPNDVKPAGGKVADEKNAKKPANAQKLPSRDTMENPAAKPKGILR